MNSPAPHFALGSFLSVHFYKFKLRLHGQKYYLHEWLARSENVRAAFRGRLKYYERNHRPPVCTQQRRHRERHLILRVGVIARMRLRAHRHVLSDLQVEQELVGIIVLAESAEWRPLKVVVRPGSEVAVERHMALAFCHPQFIVIRIEQFDSILRAFGERQAMPDLFMRSI